MLSQTFSNVNEAMSVVLGVWFKDKRITREVSPRGTRTIELTHPFATTYLRPYERVVFNPVRDANHYFHFFESMWILAGRNDVEFLKCLLPGIVIYSDDGKEFHGAYGMRLKYRNQLDNAIYELKRDPHSRRAIVTLWNPDEDSGYTGKDMPCNVAVAFKIRDNELRMTVFNRSNDAIWGAYGANAVQFAFIQEYVAAALNVRIGPYTQISDSLHVYPDNPPAGALMENNQMAHNRYLDTIGIYSVQILEGGATLFDWNADLTQFFEEFDGQRLGSTAYRTAWWTDVAAPLWRSLNAYKADDLQGALRHAEACIAPDWRLGVCEWLQRRVTRRAEKAL